jgi:hypothetical protein
MEPLRELLVDDRERRAGVDHEREGPSTIDTGLDQYHFARVDADDPDREDRRTAKSRLGECAL